MLQTHEKGEFMGIIITIIVIVLVLRFIGVCLGTRSSMSNKRNRQNDK